MPIIQLVPVEQMSLSVWDWEAKRLNKKAKELGIKADIKPFRALFDLNTNKTIIMSYYLDHDSCPFLDEKNLCKAYEERPLVCKQFPIQTVSLEEKPSVMKCPAVEDAKTKTKEEMNPYFAEIYKYAQKNDDLIRWQNQKIIELLKNKKIRPIKDYPYNFLLKRMNNSEKIDFTEYIFEEKITIPEEIEEETKQ